MKRLPTNTYTYTRVCVCVVRNGRLETLERRSSRPNFTACPSGENRSKHEVSRIPRIQAANYKCSANKVNVFIEGTRSTSFLFSLLLPLSTSRLAVTVPRVLLRCSPLVSKRPRRDSPSLHFRFRYPPNTTIVFHLFFDLSFRLRKKYTPRIFIPVFIPE